jgi:RimJ/RimL family protein N-acetyltransferase
MEFNFDEQYLLENDRVLLRPLVSDDHAHLLPYGIGDIDLWTYSLLSAYGENNFNKYFNVALDGRKQKLSYPFIVFDKQYESYAGSTRFYDIQLGHNTTQLGYTWYGKDYWGSGLNKNCKFLMLQFAFDTIGFERVEFRADNNNARSIAAMKGIGCTAEGVLRSNCKSLTGRRDSIILSILKEEWDTDLRNKLREKLI